MKDSIKALRISQLISRNLTILLISILIGVSLDSYFNIKPILLVTAVLLFLIYITIYLMMLRKNKK